MIRIFTLLLLVIPSYAQINQMDRFELTIDENALSENPEIIHLGEQGVVVYRKFFNRNKDQIEIIKLDTALNQQWKGYLDIEKNLKISQVKSSGNRVFILLRAILYGNFNFQVIDLNTITRNYSTYQVKNLIPFAPTDFTVNTNALLIGGYFNYRPVAIFHNLINNQTRLLPGFFNEEGEINQMQFLDDGSIDIIVSSRGPERKRVLWLRNYTPEGNLISQAVIQPDADKQILFAKSHRQPDGTLLIGGVFSQKSLEYSRGFFSIKVDYVNEPKFNYYYFTELENFFRFMRPKREEHVKQRIAKRDAKGKKNRQSYRFIIHQLVPYKDQFLLIGESFYPRYIYTNPYGYNSISGIGTYVRGERIFDGYRYTHSVFLALDKNGKRIWDNAFEINDVKSFTLQQFVRFSPSIQGLNLVYLNENTLRTKSIADNKTIKAKEKVQLKPRVDNDILKDRITDKSSLEPWYSSTFIASGLQYVQSTLPGRDRKVLFINKIKIQ